MKIIKNIFDRILGKSNCSKLIFFLKNLVDIISFNTSNDNNTLKNKFLNKRSFLIFPGASLNEINIKALKDEFTVGLNLVYLHKEIKNVNLSMYFMFNTIEEIDNNKNIKNELDRIIFPQNLDDQYQEKLINFLTSKKPGFHLYNEIINHLNNESFILFKDSSSNKKKINRIKKWSNKNIFYIKYFNRLVEFKNKLSKLNIDISKRFYGSNLTHINSIIILISMGFKEIYLCGAGYTYDPIYVKHFYDNYIFDKKIGLENAINQANHIVDTYKYEQKFNLKFKNFIEIGDYFHGRFFIDFKEDDNLFQLKLINEFAKLKNVKIWNIVPDDFDSPVFEKITWSEVENQL